MENCEDVKYLVFSFVCLVGGVVKWKDGKLFCLVVYIKRDVACSIDNETIMQRFQNMKMRRRKL